MRVAVDAMGGDAAPHEIVAGAILAAQTRQDLEPVLVGDTAAIESCLEALWDEFGPETRSALAHRIHVKHARTVIGMEASPVEALRRAPDSSIGRAVQLVAEQGAEAVVTAGNTGAAVAATHQALGRIKGIRRPGIAVLLPSKGKNPVVVLDVGATVKCQPIHLFHFGVMGDGFARTVLDISEPRIGLLNIGEEDEKGNELVRKTRALFTESHFRFIGNVEGQEIHRDRCDVVVCEGFVGNVVLKVTEGTAEFAAGWIEKALEGDASDDARRLKEIVAARADFSNYGGAILLGVNGICIICHGRSNRRAMCNALVMAARYVDADVIDGIIQDLKSTQTDNGAGA
jgi:glycerol-3-phosphate acyltransferase PlsX